MNFVGNHKIRLNETESTNSSLKNMAKNLLLPEGTLLVTDLQTKGRGQMDSGWISEEFKNFTGTYLLKPNIELENSFLINLIISLAVKSVIEDYVSDEKSVKIKWPNDILIDRKKVAGILIENQVKSKYISNSFIGIGINVNQISFPVFKRKATSIAVETKKHVLIDELTDKLSIHIQQFYMFYKTIGTTTLSKLYSESLYLIDEWAIYLTPEKEELMLKKVDENGQLILINKKGEELNFDIKAIKFSK